MSDVECDGYWKSCRAITAGGWGSGPLPPCLPLRELSGPAESHAWQHHLMGQFQIKFARQRGMRRRPGENEVQESPSRDPFSTNWAHAPGPHANATCARLSMSTLHRAPGSSRALSSIAIRQFAFSSKICLGSLGSYFICVHCANPINAFQAVNSAN